MVWDGLWCTLPPVDGLSTVDLDDIGMRLTDEECERLSTIDPLTESPSFGIDFYVRALEVLNF